MYKDRGFIVAHTFTFHNDDLLNVSNERQSLWPNRNNKNVPSPKNGKKSNITLAIDTEIVNMLKNVAEGEALSINSKINSILWKYIIFYKYVEQDGALIIPSRSVNFFIESIGEEKWVQEYSNMLKEIVPFFFLELKTPQTLENTLKLVFDRLLVYGGSYKGYSCHVDNDGYTNLVFRHEYGLKWSRILSTVYTQFIERTLNQPAYTLNVAETWFAIRLSERTEKLDENLMALRSY
ncbi:MAG: hypothetical protein M3275_03410, partial [Thermoproteota archaeon]|nr:hypothetical protein [Thermoproteota archaeon]